MRNKRCLRLVRLSTIFAEWAYWEGTVQSMARHMFVRVSAFVTALFTGYGGGGGQSLPDIPS